MPSAHPVDFAIRVAKSCVKEEQEEELVEVMVVVEFMFYVT